jgi:flagellar basal-body rod protein FlgG
MRSLMTAATGMKAQEMNLDVIAHNLANVNTAGFKKSEMNFEDLLYVDVRTPGVTAADGTESPVGFQVGSGVAALSTAKLHLQGTLEQTGNPLDVAIEGEGFFQIQLGGGGELGYTRNGSFHLNSAGRIVTAEGYVVGGGISIPDNADIFSIERDGTVSYRTADDPPRSSRPDRSSSTGSRTRPASSAGAGTSTSSRRPPGPRRRARREATAWAC